MESLLFARVLTCFISAGLCASLFSPFFIASLYVILRPLVQPYASAHYTIFSAVPISSLLSAIIILSALLNSIKTRARLFMNGSGIIYVFMVFSLLSLFVTIDQASSFAALVKYVTALSFATLVYNAIQRHEDIYRMFRSFAISSIIPMLFGFYQKVTGFRFKWQEEEFYAGSRIDSLFGQYNEYGIYLCMIMVVAMVLVLNEKAKTHKYVWLTILLSAGISLILSLNRGSWIALTIAFVFAYLFNRKGVSLTWLLLVFGVVGIAFSGMIIDRFDQLELQTDWGANRNTLQGRIDYWLAILEYVEKKPITGWGLGTSTIVATKYLRSDLPPHNDYIRVLLESGMFAAMAYLVALSKQLVVTIARCCDSSHWKINFPMLVLITYYMIISLTQNIVSNLILFPMFLGIISGYNKWALLIRKETEARTQSA